LAGVRIAFLRARHRDIAVVDRFDARSLEALGQVAYRIAEGPISTPRRFAP